MRIIELTQNRVTLVDADDYDWLNQWKWKYNKGYAERSNHKYEGKRITIGMHRLILKHHGFEMDGLETDHRNRDRLDNRSKNLRPATTGQNQRNSKVRHANTSGYMGVNWYKNRGQWRAYIRYRRTQKHLGYFDNPKDAARAYDCAARELHGEFASLNFPEEKKEATLPPSPDGQWPSTSAKRISNIIP